MVTQTKIKKENKQLPALSVLVSSVSDITENVMITSQRVLICWFVAHVVDFSYCIVIVIVLGRSKPLQKKKHFSAQTPPILLLLLFRFVVVAGEIGVL